MFLRTGIIMASAIALVAGSSAFAADNKSKAILIKGTVIGDNGKPCDGAEVKFLRVDTKSQEVSVVTDEKGRYSLYGLPAGDYTVTAYYHQFPRSRALIKTVGASWAKVDFDLRQDLGDGGNRWNGDIRTVRWFNVGNPH
jgi:hypothetical protein